MSSIILAQTGLSSVPKHAASCPRFKHERLDHIVKCRITSKHPLTWKHAPPPEDLVHVRIPCCAHAGAEAGGTDKQPLEIILRFYTAIKERNMQELSELISDECRCFCNFIPIIGPLEGKKQVLEMFNMLMKYMGNHVEFVIKPSMPDGMEIGVVWNLEWTKTHTPLGKGYSFHTVHIYHGKVLIRNVEMIMEPCIQLEPLRLKMMGMMVTIFDPIISFIGRQQKGRVAATICCLICLLVMAITFGLMKKYNI